MAKWSAAFFMISLMAFFYFQKDEDVISPPTGSNILTQENLHQAFAKILAKENQEKRSPASHEENLPLKTNEEEVGDATNESMSLEEEYEAEFNRLNQGQRETTIINLQAEIDNTEALLDDLEKSRDPHVTREMILKISQKLKFTQDKIDFFTSKINEAKE